MWVPPESNGYILNLTGPETGPKNMRDKQVSVVVSPVRQKHEHGNLNLFV
jgi:hypothetical protein